MKPTRSISPPGTYFVTFTTFQRRRFFIVESYARLFLKTLYGYRRQGRFKLHAFVLMPDHVHLMITPGTEITLERAIQFIKGVFRPPDPLRFAYFVHRGVPEIQQAVADGVLRSSMRDWLHFLGRYARLVPWAVFFRPAGAALVQFL